MEDQDKTMAQIVNQAAFYCENSGWSGGKTLAEQIKACSMWVGAGDNIPESGHVSFENGIAALSRGLCEQIKAAYPGEVGFNVTLIVTPQRKNNATNH